MFDKLDIYERFMECHSTTKPMILAKILDISHSTVFQWKSGRGMVPWARLKKVVDDQNLRWDWLIEGREPKRRPNPKEQRSRPLNRHGINQRFLSLFPDMSQAAIAMEFGINQTTVFKWHHAIEQVPWERLKYAVDTKGVTWEWLLEGRE